MIKVAEYVKKEVKYKEEKMATTRHETIEYKKFHSLSCGFSSSVANDFYQLYMLLVRKGTAAADKCSLR